NPFLAPYLKGAQLPVTLVLLALLAAVFLRGFGEAVWLAVGVGVPYILLNAIVAVRGRIEIAHHPELLQNWNAALGAQGLWTTLLILGGLTFPRLAVGMSGFETGVSVMPVVEGEPEDARRPIPWGRIRNTRKLLATAALIMSVMLLATSFITAVLI